MSRGIVTKVLKSQLDNFYRLIGSDFGKIVKEAHNGAGSSHSRVAFSDDFIGDAVSDKWNLAVVDTAGTAVAALLADEHSVKLVLDSNSEAESARLDMGDQNVFKSTYKPFFESLVTFTRDGAAASYAIVGLANDYNADPDAITNSVWFKIIDTGTAITIVAEGDDGTTDTDDAVINYTIVSGTQYRLAIDMNDLGQIRFYINEQEVAKGKVAVSALTGNLQPYFIVGKATGASEASLIVDYVRVESNRS